MSQWERTAGSQPSSRAIGHAFFHECALLIRVELQRLYFAILKLRRHQLAPRNIGLLPYGIVVRIDVYFDLLFLDFALLVLAPSR